MTLTSLYAQIYQVIHIRRCVLRYNNSWNIRTNSLIDCITELGYSDKEAISIIEEMVRRKLIHKNLNPHKQVGDSYIIDRWIK